VRNEGSERLCAADSGALRSSIGTGDKQDKRDDAVTALLPSRMMAAAGVQALAVA